MSMGNMRLWCITRALPVHLRDGVEATSDAIVAPGTGVVNPGQAPNPTGTHVSSGLDSEAGAILPKLSNDLNLLTMVQG